MKLIAVIILFGLASAMRFNIFGKKKTVSNVASSIATTEVVPPLITTNDVINKEEGSESDSLITTNEVKLSEVAPLITLNEVVATEEASFIAANGMLFRIASFARDESAFMRIAIANMRQFSPVLRIKKSCVVGIGRLWPRLILMPRNIDRPGCIEALSLGITFIQKSINVK